MTAAEAKACCASAHEDVAVRWLVGESLHPGGAALTSRLLTELRLGPTSTLVDIACGPGASARLAGQTYGCRVIGVDLGAETIETARAESAAAGTADLTEFMVGDAEHLPLADGTADAALCECSLCLFPDPARALGEVFRVLRPGGRIAISDITTTHDLPDVLESAAARVVCLAATRSIAELRELVVGAGLRVVRITDESAALDDLLDRVDERLAAADAVAHLLPETVAVRLAPARELLTAAQEARASRTLGYAAVIAVRPGG